MKKVGRKPDSPLFKKLELYTATPRSGGLQYYMDQNKFGKGSGAYGVNHAIPLMLHEFWINYNMWGEISHMNLAIGIQRYRVLRGIMYWVAQMKVVRMTCRIVPG